MKRLFMPIACLAVMPAFAGTAELNSAIDGVRASCGGLSEQLSHLKTMAGINTAITGVGTGVGVGAVAVGLSKSALDKEIAQLEQEIQDLIDASKDKTYPGVTLADKAKTASDLANVIANHSAEIDAKKQDVDAATEKSKTLGNVRTGLMATNTATNIAGAVIAGTNQVKDELEVQVNQCILSVNALRNVYMQERMMPDADSRMISKAEKIMSDCGAWETADIASVNKRARGAAISSGIGAGVGLAGTITSGMANSDAVRDATGDAAVKKEQNLSTASNVLAGGATAASAVATVFNATQIAAVKKVVEIADNCEGSLK